jgi:hypothetical protein
LPSIVEACAHRKQVLTFVQGWCSTTTQNKIGERLPRMIIFICSLIEKENVVAYNSHVPRSMKKRRCRIPSFMMLATHDGLLWMVTKLLLLEQIAYHEMYFVLYVWMWTIALLCGDKMIIIVDNTKDDNSGGRCKGGQRKGSKEAKRKALVWVRAYNVIEADVNSIVVGWRVRSE